MKLRVCLRGLRRTFSALIVFVASWGATAVLCAALWLIASAVLQEDSDPCYGQPADMVLYCTTP